MDIAKSRLGELRQMQSGLPFNLFPIDRQYGKKIGIPLWVGAIIYTSKGECINQYYTEQQSKCRRSLVQLKAI